MSSFDKLVISLATGAIVLGWLWAVVALGLTHPVGWLLLAGGLVLYWRIAKMMRCKPLIEWQEDEFSVGIPSLDEDHKQLVKLLNYARIAQQCKTHMAFNRQLLQELVEYTEYHFQREEALLAEHGFRNLEGHKAQHDQAIKHIKQYAQRYEDQGRSVMEELADYLERWLLQHIQGADMQFAEFLQAKGVR